MTAPVRKMTVDLDAYYASRPKPKELFRWPVHRDFDRISKPIAVFDTWGEAADYAMANNLFMGEPMRRAA